MMWEINVPQTLREASSVCHTVGENKHNKGKETKNQICSEEMVNSQECMKSVLRETEGLQSELIRTTDLGLGNISLARPQINKQQ